MIQIREMTRKKLEVYKKTLKLTEIQKEILVGTLLGDATMRLRNGKPDYAIKFEQGIKQESYINHLFTIFEPFCGSSPAVRWIDTDKTRQSIYFKTYTHPCFIYYFNSFYDINPGLTKKVPTNIHKMLTPRALAYWFMDDGSYDSKGSSCSYLLNTQGFQKSESQILMDVLENKFNLKGKIHKDKSSWRIYLYRKSTPLFERLVSPYVLASFKYKLYPIKS